VNAYVERNIDRASIIANELLQFSHIQEMELIPTDIRQVIMSSMESMEDKLGGIEVSLQVEDVPSIPINTIKMEQVFINIIGNSIDAMPNGGRLEVTATSLHDAIKIVISDNGKGISENILSKVFDPFFTTKQMNEGTGLGLSICHGIIEQHGGEIELANNSLGGVDAIILLPTE
jgi:two-component system, NtrC family, sensor kinase